MTDIKEVLRLWLSSQSKKVVARRVGLDPKTVRSYIAVGERVGLSLEQGESGLTEERLAEVMAKLRPEGLSYWNRMHDLPGPSLFGARWS